MLELGTLRTVLAVPQYNDEREIRNIVPSLLSYLAIHHP